MAKEVNSLAYHLGSMRVYTYWHTYARTHTDEMRLAHMPKVHEASAFLINTSNDILAGLRKLLSAYSAIPTHSFNRESKKKEIPFWTRH